MAVPERPVQPGSEVGTMALLEPVKGLDVLLRAAARLHERRPELRFAIIGNGPERERLSGLADDLGIAGDVAFPGYVAKEDAFERLAVFVISSYLESGSAGSDERPGWRPTILGFSNPAPTVATSSRKRSGVVPPLGSSSVPSRTRFTTATTGGYEASKQPP